ncbi:serine/threonine-protein kinase [Nocardioides montaniterrae]
MGELFGGRYELIDPIAEGGMGSVWRVLDRRDGTVKAAKLLRQRDASSLLRFIREQGTRIHHPHVVTPLGWAGADDSVLFTMPLMRGGSVATLLGDFGPLPEQWVAEIVAQTLAGLDAVHRAGVVHRDVKPGNLLLEPTGPGRPHVRLSDFGVAVPVDEPRLTHASMTFGTPGYTPPEQEAGADPEPRHDLYAVGVTGLQLLTGTRPPHDAHDLPDTPLARVLARAADPDPDRRPATAAELAAEIRAVVPTGVWKPDEVEVLDQLAVATAPPAAAPPPPPPATRVRTRESTVPRGTEQGDRPWWPIALLVLVSTLLLLAAVLLL